MRLGGAWMIGWTALGWLFFTVALLGIEGFSEASVRTHITSTARVGVVIFLLAFVASSLRRVWVHPASAWLLRNRRYLGLSFALSHFVHLGGIVSLGAAFPDPFFSELDALTLVFGGTTYLLVAAMAITSSDRAVLWLGKQRWKLLHTVGSYAIWGVFFVTLAPAIFFVSVGYVPVILALLGGLALRLAVRGRRPAPSAA